MKKIVLIVSASFFAIFNLSAQCNNCAVIVSGFGTPLTLTTGECAKLTYETISSDCAVTDTDGDGIIDANDLCPTEKGIAKYNGCAEPDEETTTALNEALTGVFFETGSDIISPNSFVKLDKVAEVLKKHNYNLEIDGHTDNVGDAASNKVLSSKRAEACKKYLLFKGIAKRRVIAKGFGDEKPVADNATDDGKAKNRRVEFLLKF